MEAKENDESKGGGKAEGSRRKNDVEVKSGGRGRGGKQK